MLLGISIVECDCIPCIEMCKIQGKTVCTCGKLLSSRCPLSSQSLSGASLPLDPASPVTPDPKAPSLVGVDEGPSFKRSPFSFENFLKRRVKKGIGMGLHKKRKGRSDEGVRGHDSKALRSTDELTDGDGFISKIAPFGKDYLPSITGLLSSSYDSWSLDVFQPKGQPDTENDLFEPSAENSCVSGEEVSELESDEDRDADGSDTEGASPNKNTVPCPHEERRSSERFLLREHHSSSARKTKRRIRRRHSKESTNKIQSSEEEERETPSTFATLLSIDDSPAPFDPTPPETSQSFSALLSSEEPVTSHRSSWGQRQEDSLDDNWQRTAPHYSREDESPIKTGTWYRDDNVDQSSFRSSNYCDPIIGDSLEDGIRPRGHSTVKSLTKNVNGLKKKIKKFEEEFESTFGYRPSHSDKMKNKEIKKYMSDLSKTKKELKQLKEDLPEKRVRNYPKPFSMSLLRCQESTAVVSQAPQTSSPTTSPMQITKDTYRQVEERLCVKRNEAGRPLKVADLTLDQLKEEKTDIQKALLFYESVHGRPSTREDKELVRPLYDRYRLVKRSVNKLISRPKENVIELAPILEHVAMDFTLASPHRGSLQGDVEAQEEVDAISSHPINPDPHPEVTTPTTTTTELNLGDLHALPIHELKERKKEAREEKRRLRHSLRDYEEKFERETGRKMQKEDRGPMEKNYNEYKHVKAKLRLLEALLSKHSS